MSAIYSLLVAFIVPAAMFAQTATLRGQVADQSGAIVPTATVRLTAPDGKIQTTTADSNGVYGFSGGELPPKESIREIRINQNPFAPEYDRLGLGRI